ncbi:50S ribosomal protein L11 methyltransferase [Solirubrobacter sp. CPCC 204708]|uniref:50S ribosomal protein L11 methyltransferase n=1 Tax=Solirubrobacter deserti TaxID=2282478 RepID=A0ABT4RTC0_9ACTN|nr:50S ribosomal protein L11 methyltransferase [Solirubrobacter deserti]MBE2316283.1 50S ribosomal protein L11 methyltransferase [Solirubrobacter deserti]MDA0141490.1 50S ribosomal protein L11 methyltransferase [Solirubrobacter deserti]
MIRLAVRVRREHAEVVLLDLMAFAPGGLEEIEDGDFVEYVLYGAPGELPEIGDVRAAAGDAVVDVSTSEVPDVDWHSFHVPIDVGPIRVRPPWHEPRDGALDVVIEPGQGFGTGSHATTRLTLELLTELEPEGALADWGCGSGILAIAAAKLGWSPVLACDIEPESVAEAIESARVNEVELEVTRCDVRAGGPPAPTVLANLVRPLLLQVAQNLSTVPDRLIVSGLELDEVDEVLAAFARHGLTQRARREGGGWAAIELVRT